MKILAIDSSGMTASAALLEDGLLRAEYTVNYKKTHSQTLLPMIDEIVRMTELDLNSLDAIAVAGGRIGDNAEASCPPCGVCRQALAEFCDMETFRVYLAAPGGGVEETTLGALLPRAFARANLDKS